MSGVAPGPRVFCIGRNYADHAKELNNPVPAAPVVFMKPAACLVPPGDPIRFPPHGEDLQHEVEIVVRIGDGGTDVTEAEALGRLDAITVGFDLTLRDVQQRLKAKGLPWEQAKAFEGAAPLGEFVPLDRVDPADLHFHCDIGGERRQSGHTADMLFPIPRLVAHLSAIWTLAPGDLIYTGTPAGVGPVRPGDRLMAAAEGIGEFTWDVLGR
jgi:2-keto-4-pentenoate hydratase/2-oxohepta-3-ene-1,7-dioic acid hydratase in catechol pathway